MSQVSQTRHDRRLMVSEVEEAFVRVAVDLKEIIVLDGVEGIDSPPGFRIRSHDLYGLLPDVAIEDTGDRYPVLDRIIREAANLIAMARIRQELAESLPGCAFLLPTLAGQGVVVGVRSNRKTILAEGPSFRDAYQALLQKASEVS